MERLTLNISGMSCGHCVGRVRAALESTAGVRVEGVEIGSATVMYDPAKVTIPAIAEAVTNAGYDAQPGDTLQSRGSPI
jgi:copper chaperone